MSRASTGDVPPVDTAICTGERSMMAGMMKLDSSRFVDDVARDARGSGGRGDGGVHSRSSVAATTSQAPSMSVAANSRA
jgi:hypothetical protein